jgi:hypothetical protein
VAEKYERARASLFTWPTDLAVARRLVREYQDDLTGAPAQRRPVS